MYINIYIYGDLKRNPKLEDYPHCKRQRPSCAPFRLQPPTESRQSLWGSVEALGFGVRVRGVEGFRVWGLGL